LIQREKLLTARYAFLKNIYESYITSVAQSRENFGKSLGLLLKKFDRDTAFEGNPTSNKGNFSQISGLAE